MQHPRRAGTRARAPLAGVVLVGVLGAGLAGCSDGETSRVSRAEMVRRADAICADGLAESERLRAEAVPGARGEAAATEIDATLAALATQVEGLGALRGPPATDAARERLVRRLTVAADGLEVLRDAAADEDLTVDEAIRANPDVVARVNRASAAASDALLELGFLGCVGVGGQ